MKNSKFNKSKLIKKIVKKFNTEYYEKVIEI